MGRNFDAARLSSRSTLCERSSTSSRNLIDAMQCHHDSQLNVARRVLRRRQPTAAATQATVPTRTRDDGSGVPTDGVPSNWSIVVKAEVDQVPPASDEEA